MNALRRIGLALALAVGLIAANVSGDAAAISLNEARASGAVGETRSGFLAPVRGPTAEVQALIQTVNAQRRSHYQSIAQRNGLRIEEVGRLSAEKIINGLPAGAYFQGANGAWTRK